MVDPSGLEGNVPASASAGPVPGGIQHLSGGGMQIGGSGENPIPGGIQTLIGNTGQGPVPGGIQTLINGGNQDGGNQDGGNCQYPGRGGILNPIAGGGSDQNRKRGGILIPISSGNGPPTGSGPVAGGILNPIGGGGGPGPEPNPPPPGTKPVTIIQTSPAPPIAGGLITLAPPTHSNPPGSRVVAAADGMGATMNGPGGAGPRGPGTGGRGSPGRGGGAGSPMRGYTPLPPESPLERVPDNNPDDGSNWFFLHYLVHQWAQSEQLDQIRLQKQQEKDYENGRNPEPPPMDQPLNSGSAGTYWGQKNWQGGAQVGQAGISIFIIVATSLIPQEWLIAKGLQIVEEGGVAVVKKLVGGKWIRITEKEAEALGKEWKASAAARGRHDGVHTGGGAYDLALKSARKNAGSLGEKTSKMYDPRTGTLIGEQSMDGKRGWRIDNGHINWWNWTNGKKGSGGMYGHEYFPSSQTGPHSEYLGYAPWQNP